MKNGSEGIPFPSAFIFVSLCQLSTLSIYWPTGTCEHPELCNLNPELHHKGSYQHRETFHPPGLTTPPPAGLLHSPPPTSNKQYQWQSLTTVYSSNKYQLFHNRIMVLWSMFIMPVYYCFCKDKNCSLNLGEPFPLKVPAEGHCNVNSYSYKSTTVWIIVQVM